MVEKRLCPDCKLSEQWGRSLFRALRGRNGRWPSSSGNSLNFLISEFRVSSCLFLQPHPPQLPHLYSTHCQRACFLFPKDILLFSCSVPLTVLFSPSRMLSFQFLLIKLFSSCKAYLQFHFFHQVDRSRSKNLQHNEKHCIKESFNWPLENPAQTSRVADIAPFLAGVFPKIHQKLFPYHVLEWAILTKQSHN